MIMDADRELHDNSVAFDLDLDRFGEILKDALAVPAKEGLALLIQTQIARAAGSEAPASAVERPGCPPLSGAVTCGDAGDGRDAQLGVPGSSALARSE